MAHRAAAEVPYAGDAGDGLLQSQQDEVAPVEGQLPAGAGLLVDAGLPLDGLATWVDPFQAERLHERLDDGNGLIGVQREVPVFGQWSS